MSFEGFLKVLKPMFKMTNWKDAPTSVALNWITKAVMHWRDPQRGSWYTDHVTPTSEFSTDIGELAIKSQMVTHVNRAQPLHSIRWLRKVVRGPDEVRCGDWIIVRQAGRAGLACQVLSMMECVPRGGRFAVIRLWCAGVQIRDDSVTGDILADKNEPLRRKIVQFESVHVQVVSRVETASCIQFH